jgi:hypothetical protein
MAFLLAGNIIVLFELDYFMKYTPLGFFIVGIASVVTILATIDSYLDIFRKQREARKVLESID